MPYIVKEYAADGTTELRHSQTDYNLGSAYVGQHIIGLVSSSELYDAANHLQAKVTYGYDTTSINAQATSAAVFQSTSPQNSGFKGNQRELGDILKNFPNFTASIPASLA